MDTRIDYAARNTPSLSGYPFIVVIDYEDGRRDTVSFQCPARAKAYATAISRADPLIVVATVKDRNFSYTSREKHSVHPYLSSGYGIGGN